MCNQHVLFIVFIIMYQTFRKYILIKKKQSIEKNTLLTCESMYANPYMFVIFNNLIKLAITQSELKLHILESFLYLLFCLTELLNSGLLMLS